MGKRTTIILRVVLVVFVIGLIANGVYEYVQGVEKREQARLEEKKQSYLGGLDIGEKAPDFMLQTIQGESVSLSAYAGNPVVVNFWATWCKPCRTELPALIDFYEQTNVPVLAVNLTKNERRGVTDVEAFLEETPLSFPVLLDRDASVEQLYKIIALPTTYVIAADGRIVAKHTGPIETDWLYDAVEDIEKTK